MKSKEGIFQSRTNIFLMKASSPMTFQHRCQATRSTLRRRDSWEVKLINSVFSISEELPRLMMIYVFIKGKNKVLGRGGKRVCEINWRHSLHDDRASVMSVKWQQRKLYSSVVFLFMKYSRTNRYYFAAFRWFQCLFSHDVYTNLKQVMLRALHMPLTFVVRPENIFLIEYFGLSRVNELLSLFERRQRRETLQMQCPLRRASRHKYISNRREWESIINV